MEFEGQYLTYRDYKTLEGTLDQMPFNLLEFECRRKIDIRTQNRLIDLNYGEIPQTVKLCINEMINTVQGYAKAKENSNTNGGKKSENTDGYSVTFMTADEISNIMQSKEKELNDIIYSYLTELEVNGEKLMFPGV